VKDQPRSEIAIGGYRFDPLEGVDLPPEDRLEDRPEHLKAPEAIADYIVQFHRALTREDRAYFEGRYSLRLTEFIPERAYLEELADETAADLGKDDRVRAVIRYEPAFKLDPQLGQRRFVTEEREAAGLLLIVIGFDRTDARGLAAEIAELGLEVTAANQDGEARTPRLIVRARELRDAARIARLPDVRTVEEVGDVTLNNGTTSWVLQSNTTNSRPIWAKGIRGEGQIIGHIDGPIDLNHCFFQDTANNTPRPAHRKVVGVRNAAGGTTATAHGTFSAGNAAGEDVNNDALSAAPNADNGNAPRARLSHGYLMDLDFIPNGTETFLSYLLQQANDGAFIHTNSWDDKSTSAYTQLSVDADRFTWANEDHLVIIGPDNNGTIRPPDSAKNPLVVNATRQSPNQNSFASGITQFSLDGRRKPDVMAPGQNINSATSGTACGTGLNSGTSFAAPAVAGAAALVRQYYTEGWYPTGTRQTDNGFVPSGALLKATLINSAADVTGITGFPAAANMGEGWGRVLLENALFFDGQQRNSAVWDVRHADGLLTGETAVHHIDVVGSGEPLKVVLAWSDPPAAAGSATPVVNDLDLVVTSPDGSQTFRGNVFANGVSATGGTADALNNVEVVLINNPMLGDWRVAVTGSTVNVGAPGQGFALAATGDLAKAPVPTGAQDTLVVRVKFADIAFEPALVGLQNKMQRVARYISEVSYGQATVVPTFAGPFTLDHPRDYYFHPTRNPLVELTQEVVAKLVLANPSTFDRGTGNPADDIDRLVIVTNDANFTGDWATTGPWPYDMPAGFQRPLSVSIQGRTNSAARFSHGLCHQFGLVDVYAHPGVVFPRPYVDEWDVMSGQDIGVHPLVWSKQRAGWVSAHGSEITYIPRPAAGGTYTGPNPIPLFFQESTAQNRKAIAIGLTEGAATLDQEDVLYILEARSNTLGGSDDDLPATGVLAYYVNERIPQGEGPVILLDRSPGTATLSDAAFRVGDARTIPGTGITFTVLAGAAGAAFRIQLAYAPPVTDYNVSIVRGDTIAGTFYPWFSPDIWIDSPKNGYGLAGGPGAGTPESPVAAVVNRIYARIRNAGPGTAFDFDVRFRISEPYHTVGGEPDFNRFVDIKHVSSLAPSAGDLIVGPAEWTPTSVGDPHNCVLVDIINLVGTDTNPHDNWAQENFRVVASVTASPYQPVQYSFGITNPYPQAALFYFLARGAPEDWTTAITPRKILLGPGEYAAGTLTVQPPEDARVCTSHHLAVTSWTPRGDTLIPVGGALVQVDLRRRTMLTLDAGTERCDGRDLEELYERLKKQDKPIDPERLQERCGRVTAQGCTDPPAPHQEIIVKYVRPDGTPEFHTVTTDENGCFEDFIVTADGGSWGVEAEYPGDECQGPVTTGVEVLCRC
jgi:M6 family metalloprotease-like protein